MASNCNYKLLKNAYIGMGVRMTKGKDTIPFDNEPMTGMKITHYTKLGFKISHPNLGKDIWVEFRQLPLTELTIINGVIQDEITFVENIIAHQMELIKTSNPEYQQLLKIEEEEKLEEFVTLSQIKPGEMVVSALCKEGIPMTYLGTWYTKNAIRFRSYYSYYYSEHKKRGIYLSKTSPERAFFIVETEDLTPAEEEIINSIDPIRVERRENEDWNDYYVRQEEQRKIHRDNIKKKKNELRKLGPNKRYKIIAYPTSSKRVKKLIKTNFHDENFVDLNFNKNLILYTSSKNDGGYYGSKNEQTDLVELKDSFIKPEYSDFIITNKNYSLSDINYLDKSRIDINKRAYKFINDNFKCKLKENKVAISDKEIEDLNFLD